MLDTRPLPAARPSPLDEDIRRLREEKRKLDEQAAAWEARKGDDPWAASDNSAWADPWRAETPSQLGTPGPDSTSSDRDDWARDGGRLEDIADQLTPANIAAEGHDSYRKALEEMERREMAEAQRRREEAKRREMAEVQRKLEMDAKRRGQEVEHSREEIVRRKPERREASKTGRRSGSGLFGSGDAGQYARRREEATRQADSRRRQEAATRREEGRRRQEAATRQADSRRRQEAATRREEGRRRQRQEAEGQAALQRRQQEIAKQKRQHERHETVRKRAWVAKSYPCSEDGAPGQGAAYIRRMAPKHIMSRTTLGTRNCDRNSIEKSARDFYGKCSAARRKCTRTSGKFVYDLELDEKDIVHSCKFTWKMTSRCMPYQPWRFTPSVGNSGSVQ